MNKSGYKPLTVKPPITTLINLKILCGSRKRVLNPNSESKMVQGWAESRLLKVRKGIMNSTLGTLTFFKVFIPIFIPFHHRWVLRESGIDPKTIVWEPAGTQMRVHSFRHTCLSRQTSNIFCPSFLFCLVWILCFQGLFLCSIYVQVICFYPNICLSPIYFQRYGGWM